MKLTHARGLVSLSAKYDQVRRFQWFGFPTDLFFLLTISPVFSFSKLIMPHRKLPGGACDPELVIYSLRLQNLFTN